MNRVNVSILFFLIILALPIAAGNNYQIATLTDGTEYISNRVIVVRQIESPELATGNSIKGTAVTGVESIDIICRSYGVLGVERYYRGKLTKEPLRELASRMYIFNLADGIDASAVAADLALDRHIKSAELQAIPQLFYVPNDPEIHRQWYLEKIQAFTAWDFVRGDATRHSIIAVIDAGINYNHSDLYGNIWYNEDEQLNGEDDDENGFIDDIQGWDFAEEDNDPEEIFEHGSGVAACISEATDNGVMGAGIGFSCQLMNLKGISDHANLVEAYMPMFYAAENGAQVINCSWGIPVYREYEQDIINAVWDAGVLIIAAGGSVGTMLEYPAAYDNVMAVSATDQNDHRAPFAPYGEHIDICAPGVDIAIPWGDDFSILSGTSFSAGMVAGLAGLVATLYPQFTNQQIQQLIEDAADPIDDLNPSYEGLLGAGRINAANCMMTAIDDDPILPQHDRLLGSYPNPFNAQTQIRYELSKSADVSITIYDIMGRRVQSVTIGYQEPGLHFYTWDAGGLASGIYFAKLQNGEATDVVRMVLLK